jgi:hypothetical protein
MKKITATDILDAIKIQYPNAWFIGQRKWSCALARNVLELERQLRAANTSHPDLAKSNGLVFLTNINEVNENLILECDKLFVFDADKQLSALQAEPGSFITAINQKVENEQELTPQMITRTADVVRNRYAFASLIGSIPDFETYPIKIYVNDLDSTWRFSHE